MADKEIIVPETPRDFGAEVEFSGDAQDIVDQTVWSIMDEIVASGSSEAEAEKKVNAAIDKLIDDEIITEIPDYDQPDAVKAMWISAAAPSIRHYLTLHGDLL